MLEFAHENRMSMLGQQHGRSEQVSESDVQDHNSGCMACIFGNEAADMADIISVITEFRSERQSQAL